MPAITIVDLNNAKADVDHITQVASSNAATVTDRFGNTKKTISKVIADAETRANTEVTSVRTAATQAIDSVETAATQEVADLGSSANAAMNEIVSNIGNHYADTYDEDPPPGGVRLVDIVSPAPGAGGIVETGPNAGWYKKTGAAGQPGWERLPEQPAAETAVLTLAQGVGQGWSREKSPRALLSSYDDGSEESAPPTDVTLDAAGSVIGGPDVIRQLASESARGVDAWRAGFRRALHSSFDPSPEDQVLDAAGNIVSGPGAISEILEMISHPAPDPDPGPIGPQEPAYLEGGILRLAVTRGPRNLASVLPDEFIASPHARGSAWVSATNRASIGSVTPVIVANGMHGYPWVMPSGQILLMVVPAFGQSNSVGSQAYVPPEVMTSSEWEETLLMFDLANGVPDVRMGLPAGGQPAGSEEVLDGDNLIGFRPLVSVQSAAQSNRGATPLEGFGFTIAREARQRIGIDPRILCFTAGYGGRPYSGIRKGTIPYANLVTALTRAKALADERGWAMWVPFVLLVHGGGDSINPNYYTALQTLQADITGDVQSITGQQGPVSLICPQAGTFFSDEDYGVRATYDICKASPVHILSAPHYNLELAPDNQHIGNRSIWLGEKMAHTAMRERRLWGGDTKGALKPSAVTYDGDRTITIALDVPRGPVVRDTTDPIVNHTPPANWGFEIHDGAGSTVVISSIEIVDGNSIRIVCASPPSPGALRAVRYAMTGYPGDIATGTRVRGLQARGQVRDSETTPSIVDGAPLYNWLVHFSEQF